MADSVSLLLGTVVLLALAMQQTGAAETRVFDLPKKIQEFVNQQSKAHNVPVIWWSMHGDHDHLVENAAEYSKYKVSTRVGPLQYGSVSKSSVLPKVVHTEWSHNGLPTEPVVVTVKRAKTLTHQYSWQTQDTFTVGTSVSIEAGLPGVADFTGSFSTTVSLSNTAGQVHTDAEKYAVDLGVTVPPMKSAKIEWVITDVTQEIPWTAQIDIEGWFAVWFQGKVKDHYLWFYNVKDLDDALLEQTEKGVRYTARGIFNGVHGTEAHLRVSQYDLGAYGGKPTKVYTIPLSSPRLRSR
uniref:Putative cytotoxin n=1 Tax=Ixodes scapularis TaxID=6945 RepID=A0A4D5S324_IXOSC